MRELMTMRFLNIIFVLICLPVAVIAHVAICFLVKLTSRGPVLHWSKRIGQNNELFLMPKYRTMKIDTPQLATHLIAQTGQSYLTPIGPYLRKTSLDELPQLWSIFKGDMNLVGPRPALFNQDDLKELRTKCGVQQLKPGLTGWAQINGRDELSIPDKVSLDKYYLDNRNMALDFKIILLTIYKVFKRSNIQH